MTHNRNQTIRSVYKPSEYRPHPDRGLWTGVLSAIVIEMILVGIVFAIMAFAGYLDWGLL